MGSQVWIVTGSARGLGRAVTEAALAAGHRVVAAARRPERLADLVDRYPEDLLAVPVDVTDPASVAAAVDAAQARFGGVDVLVNNAGYANLAAFEDVTADDFRAQLETNLFGVVTVTKAVLPLMRRRGAGHIINVSSVGGRVGTPGLAAYQTAKWAVNGLSQVLAAEVGPLGIRVTSVEPGGMQTDWAGASMAVSPVGPGYEQTVGAMAAMHDAGGATALGDPAKVAQALLRLADLADPPVRLLLGSDAVGVAGAAARTLADSDARWAAFSRSTDRDDATPEQRDPLGLGRTDPVAVVRRYLDEVVNGGKIDVLDELWAEDGVWHGGSLGERHGLDEMREFAAGAGAGAFTGMHLVVHDEVTAGDKVVVRFTNSGTQSGPFLGAPASGRHAEWLGIGLYTVTDGRISEAWFGEDVLGMLQQLGIVTLPA